MHYYILGWQESSFVFLALKFLYFKNFYIL